MGLGSAEMSREAGRILDAFASRRLIAPLRTGDPSFDEDEAYAIALEIYRRRVLRGETPIGRKIGFTNTSGANITCPRRSGATSTTQPSTTQTPARRESM
jgi:2-keto-4-pentenoate hydratase